MQSPTILLPGTFSQADIEELRNNQHIWREADIYEQQLSELFDVTYPGKQKQEQDFAAFCKERGQGTLAGAWIYYPWSGTLLHTVNEQDLLALRSSRNKNLITAEEQASLYEACIGIFGLSVGNSIALTLTYGCIAKNMKLADMDVIETPNLNRLRATLAEVSIPKVDIAAQQIYEVNPFASLTLVDEGVHDDNLEQFLSNPKPQVVFDEIDDFPMKIKLRLKARELGVPVIMLTSLGDNILVDIERYDLDSSTALFNGLIGDTPEQILQTPIGELEKVKYAIDIVGAEHIPTRALESLFEINRTLMGRPQLAGTIAIDGGVASLLVRRLVLGQELPSGRYYLSLEKALGLSIIDDEVRRNAALHTLDQLLGRS